MELVDTHCHIQSAGLQHGGERTTQKIWAKNPALTGDVLVKNARQAGVTRMIVVGCDLSDSQLAVDFVQNHSECYSSIGIHPHEAKEFVNQTALLQQFAELAKKPKVLAVGECGLDYYYNHSDKESQITLLRYQIELAITANLPLIFHVRDAFSDFWPIYDSYTDLRGVLHSYTDSADNLTEALKRGLYVGVNGIATFAKDPKQLEVYRSVPLTSLLLETDAPFLTPTPYRGTVNEPKYVSTIADFIADAHQVQHQVIADATTVNARKLFGI